MLIILEKSCAVLLAFGLCSGTMAAQGGRTDLNQVVRQDEGNEGSSALQDGRTDLNQVVRQDEGNEGSSALREPGPVIGLTTLLTVFSGPIILASASALLLTFWWCRGA